MLNFAKDTGLKADGRFAELAREYWFPSPVVLESGRLISVSEPPLASPALGEALRSVGLDPSPFTVSLSLDVVSFDVGTPGANTFWVC